MPPRPFAVIYRYGSDTDAMDKHRPAHREYLGELFRRGSILASGPVSSNDGAAALLIMTASDEREIAELLDRDPFAVEGLIAHREIGDWNIVYDSLDIKDRLTQSPHLG
ncbi:YciI family protein [Rhodococcus opacus]|nr:YciI family protein [Rhodococcus opacus]